MWPVAVSALTMVLPCALVPPAWRGPFSWSSMRFQTAHPSVQLFRSLMTFLARRWAASQVPPDTALCVEQVFVGEGIMDHADVIEVVASVPVEGGAPDVL